MLLTTASLLLTKPCERVRSSSAEARRPPLSISSAADQGADFHLSFLVKILELPGADRSPCEADILIQAGRSFSIVQAANARR